MTVRQHGRSLLYGCLALGAVACGMVARLSQNHLWLGGSFFAVPLCFDCALRWYRLRIRERRDTRLFEIIEQQHAAMLSITSALSADQTPDSSIAGLHALNSSMHDLAQLLSEPLGETQPINFNGERSEMGGKNQ